MIDVCRFKQQNYYGLETVATLPARAMGWGLADLEGKNDDAEAVALVSELVRRHTAQSMQQSKLQE